MKKVFFIAVLSLICFITSACSGQIADSSSTTEITTTLQAATEPLSETTKRDEKPTEEPAVIKTEPEKHEYTAVELADKSLSEIIEIMGGDFDVDNGEKYLIHYTSGPARNIYNDSTLPGFAFFLEPKEGISYSDLADDTDFDGVKADVLAGKLEIKFIGLFTGAKYDENISVGMKYLDISEAMDHYSLTPPAGSEAMRQTIKYSDKESPAATVYYRASGDDEEKARQENPESWGIAVFPDK